MSPPEQLDLGLEDRDGVREAVRAFDRNIALRASAGTGKTEALTELYLHLVAGLTDLGRPVSPERIVAVTFTEKAAWEMRERIGASLRWLAGRDPTARAPRVCEVVRRGMRQRNLPAEVFARALDSLPAARITTLHALCAGLLHASPIEAVLGPEIRVLDERESRGLLRRSLVAAVEARLVAGDDAVRELVRDHRGLFGVRDGGLVPVLARLHAEVSETGRAPESLLDGDPYGETARTEAAAVLGMSPFELQTGSLTRAWDTLIAAHEVLPRAPGMKAATRKVCERVAEAAARLRESAPVGTDDVAALSLAAQRLEAACGSGKAAAVESAATVRRAAIGLWALPVQRGRARALLELLSDGQRRFTEAKARVGGLDFSDLTLRARDLLRDHPDLRRELVAGVDALLVDEFQDTNAVQRDLVYLLRARESVDARVPLPPELLDRGLFVVGDRKQSIYGFRNADVVVFEELVSHIVATGGRELSLRRSFRGVQPLVHALNALTQQALRAGGELPFEIHFDPGSEALEPVSAGDPAGGAAVELLELAEDVPQAEAEPVAIARHLVALADRAQVRGGDGAWRPLRFGDVALLLPRFTRLELFTRALDEHGIPHAVVHGRGLLSTAEARDVLALLAVLTGADDALAIATVLRSPIAALSDATLLGLATNDGGLRGLFAGRASLPEWSTETERRRFDVTWQLLEHLRFAVNRIGLGAAARLAVEQTGYAAVLCGLPGGMQRVANVDRLLAEVVEREHAGEDGRTILSDLLVRAADDRDPEADVIVEGDDAVRVMTVHQSKGLQFPCVIAADLGRQLTSIRLPVTYDRQRGAGLAVGVRGPLGGWLYGPHHDHVSSVRARRERAERLRLFYVQITRARDRLVLVGTAGGIGRDIVDPVADELARAGLLARVPAPAPRSAVFSTGARFEPLPAEDWADLLRRSGPPQPSVGVLEVPVTQLEDFALCQRRFRARHILRLPERPEARVPASPEVDVDLGTDARTRGTAIHAVLERLDLGLLGRDPKAAMERAAAEAQLTGDLDVWTPLRSLLRSGLVERMVDPAVRVHRELAFALAVDAGEATLVLRGQIDLVLDDGATVDVIDYKATSPRGVDPVAPYRFQLGAYALAMRRASDPGREVRAAVQFLDGRPRQPLVAEGVEAEIVAQLPELATALLRARCAERFEGRPRAACEALRCGFQWLCHG